MTTVVSPNSSPAPVYNRSGTTLVTVVAGVATPPNQPSVSFGVSIPSYSGHTVALLTVPSGWTNTSGQLVVILPSGVDIGDIVEVYAIPSAPGQNTSFVLFSASGETLNSGISDSDGIDPENGKIYRKVSATNWQSVG
jgi:hypothetical protein